MSVPRLTFLYPHLFNANKLQKSQSGFKPLCASKKLPRKAGFSSTRQRREETYAQRYGPAADPLPLPFIPQNSQEDNTLAGAIEQEVKVPAQQPEKKSEPAPVKEPEKPASESKKEASLGRDKSIENTSKDPAKRAIELDASESHPKEWAEAPPRDGQGTRTTKPLDIVLEMGPPATEKKPEEQKPPHLHAPPYVHHFDTFTLVKDLERGDFTEDQSITLMKAVRSLLALNLDVAREGLVSKSDVENETYLSRAACSELRTEILNTRKSSSAKTQTLLSHLQYQTDILSQRVSQDTLTLRDDLKGMLNDRRMDSRMEGQGRDSEISELNYKISVALNSDAKSEVEGMRWVVTKRSVTGVAFFVFMILGSLYMGKSKGKEEAKKAEAKGTSGGGGNYTTPSREMGTQTEGGGKDSVLEKGESVGYVSLG